MNLPSNFTGRLGSYQSVLANLVLAFSARGSGGAHSRAYGGYAITNWILQEENKRRRQQRRQWNIERQERIATILQKVHFEEERHQKKKKEKAMYSVLLAEL